MADHLPIGLMGVAQTGQVLSGESMCRKLRRQRLHQRYVLLSGTLIVMPDPCENKKAAGFTPPPSMFNAATGD
jgi:hypothetical protein